MRYAYNLHHFLTINTMMSWIAASRSQSAKMQTNKCEAAQTPRCPPSRHTLFRAEIPRHNTDPVLYQPTPSRCRRICLQAFSSYRVAGFDLPIIATATSLPAQPTKTLLSISTRSPPHAIELPDFSSSLFARVLRRNGSLNSAGPQLMRTEMMMNKLASTRHCPLTGMAFHNCDDP